MTTRTLDYLPLDDIPRATVNPKRHDLSVIEASIGRHGYAEPVLLDERTGRLVGGHGRLDALAAMRDAGEDPPEGIGPDWSVPVIRGWSSKSDLDAAAMLVTLNRASELGGWDDATLGMMLEPMLDLPEGLDGVGYTADEIREMVGTVPDFQPEPTGGQPRLDQRNPVICPACAHEFHPR